MRPVRRNRQLATALLLMAASIAPELLWAGAHAVEHHHEAEAAGHDALRCPAASRAADALLHGHGHPDGVPEHEHRLLSSPPFRHDPQSIARAGPAAALSVFASGPPSVMPGPSRSLRPAEPPGSSPPPRLELLCTLLI